MAALGYSRSCFRNFILLFWNQVFICFSLKASFEASRVLSWAVMKWLIENSFSIHSSCHWVNMDRFLLFFLTGNIGIIVGDDKASSLWEIGWQQSSHEPLCSQGRKGIKLLSVPSAFTSTSGLFWLDDSKSDPQNIPESNSRGQFSFKTLCPKKANCREKSFCGNALFNFEVRCTVEEFFWCSISVFAARSTSLSLSFASSSR